MIITEKEKNSHYKWLLFKFIPKFSLNSFMEPKKTPDSEIFQLLPKQGQLGRVDRFPILTDPVFLKHNRRISLVYKEEWMRIRISQNKLKYEFNRISLKLSDEEFFECISIHWNPKDQLTVPYQPHVHINSQNRYYFNKIHIPLNNWGKYYPANIEEYHAWLNGLIDFLNSEFPRCLKK